MNSLKMIYLFTLVAFSLFVAGCGDEENVTSSPRSETQQPVDTKKYVPGLNIPALTLICILE